MATGIREQDETLPVYSIMYARDGEIYKCGPWHTEQDAKEWIAKNHKEEFNLHTEYVYLLHPNHRMEEIEASDVGVGDEE